MSASHFLENVGDDDEEVGGQGITLSEAVPATDPVAGHPVKDDSSVPSVEEVTHPAAPPSIKTPGLEDGD